MKRINKILCIFASILLITGILPINIFASPRTGNGEVIPGKDVLRLFTQVKELDISESDINITISEEERNTLREEAKASAFNWLWKMIILQQDKEYWIVSEEDPMVLYHPDNEGIKNYINKRGLNQKYWQDTLNTDDIEVNEIARGVIDKIKSYGSIDSILERINNAQDFNDEELIFFGELIEVPAYVYDFSDSFIDSFSEEEKEIYQTKFFFGGQQLEEIDYDSLSDAEKNVYDKLLTEHKRKLNFYYNAKIEEIYNDKYSDLLVSKLSKDLPVKVNFKIMPISDDEKDKFGIEGEVLQGKMSGDELLVSTIDFGANNQFYDEILKDGAKEYIENYEELFNSSDDYLLRDARDFVTHILLIDDGFLMSTDNSQVSYSYARGNENYPGFHSLLSISDPLGTYSWAKFQFPGPKYTQTFNLHLNPAVTYLGTKIKADLISDVKFDDSGRVLSVSKPLVINKDITSLLDSNTTPGTYRFKYVEESVSADGINNDAFVNDDSVKYIDIYVGGNYSTVLDYIGVETSILIGYQNKNNLFIDGYNVGEVYKNRKDYDEIYDPTQPVVEEVVSDAKFLNRIAYTDVTVTKTWDDGDNADGLRPSTEEFLNKVKLLADDKEYKVDRTAEENKLPYKEIVDNGDNTYTITYHNLPKNVKYSVEEDTIENYELVVEEAAPTSTTEESDNDKIEELDQPIYKYEFDLTNKHTPETTEVSVNKVWVDDNDKDKVRPTSVKVELLADGEKVNEVELSQDNEWKYTFTNLPKNKEGKEIVYTVDEVAVEGYEKKIEKYTITNTYIPEEPEPEEPVVPEEPKKYDFEVYKLDSFGYGLHGAELALKDSEGRELESWTSDGEAHKLTYGDGVYILEEIEAPYGFELHEPVEFTLSEGKITLNKESENVSVEGNAIKMVDPRDMLGVHQMTFSKLDENGNHLKGATIRLIDDNNNVFDEWVSDGTPHVQELKPNTYWFIEVEAPSGYKKVEKFSFEVDDKGLFKLVNESSQYSLGNNNLLEVTDELENPTPTPEPEPTPEPTPVVEPKPTPTPTPTPTPQPTRNEVKPNPKPQVVNTSAK